ncbi:hypothetical protein I6M90_00810 [Acinetobacter bereziniae]|uniref:hypothetical protein n=1 Tax=Acinetobacter bereziniae TaxID=106648 RepID=UPI00190139C3|nr:hypothetical protein [Acinetobacter bereziniae]MBJ8450352.1 hypothetical protein [Acinetobacter bereziniae]MBJ8454613.1 hypothetical protein [Acinetobacter bereziniae]
MATTAAERKAKQRQEMIDKGFVRKDLWLSKESIEAIEKYKTENNLKSNDEAINLILKTLT